ncbi:MAG: 4-(cytidine 5'-diphospho)-2-C-methyl-D-erythritol kinase [Desulfobacteraceae bacterium]|nr:MAG: 4-(cytidine 5'-diphospho)-2-C-methyl-D-erythritol kinase [Desulfobacteraceae bacterium]
MTKNNMDKIYIKTPAKLNVRLKVIGRRPNGYHDLVSIMAPITLFDELELEKSVSEITLTSEGFRVPNNADNLVYRAAELFLKQAGLKAGVQIKLKKGIPVAAGMGGGSSDAAATLRSLNELFSRPFSFAELSSMAVQLGADVPFFLQPRPCIARGIGEILEPIENWPEMRYVIVHPPLEISTAWVYANLKLGLTGDEDGYIRKCLKFRFSSIASILENDLEQVTIAHYPVIDSIKSHLLKAGAEGALMTGSGPTVFGLFSSLDKAQTAAHDLAAFKLGDIFVVTHWQGQM